MLFIYFSARGKLNVNWKIYSQLRTNSSRNYRVQQKSLPLYYTKIYKYVIANLNIFSFTLYFMFDSVNRYTSCRRQFMKKYSLCKWNELVLYMKRRNKINKIEEAHYDNCVAIISKYLFFSVPAICILESHVLFTLSPNRMTQRGDLVLKHFSYFRLNIET